MCDIIYCHFFVSLGSFKLYTYLFINGNKKLYYLFKLWMFFNKHISLRPVINNIRKCINNLLTTIHAYDKNLLGKLVRNIVRRQMDHPVYIMYDIRVLLKTRVHLIAHFFPRTYPPPPHYTINNSFPHRLLRMLKR